MRGRTAKKFWLPVFALSLLFFGPPAKADDSECFRCHKNPRLSKGKKDGSLLSLHVDEGRYQASVHGAAGLGCTECHAEAKAAYHPAEGFPEVDCAACHADQLAAYRKTAHGMMREGGMENAPKCADCHTAHYIRKAADPLSPVSEARLPAACAQCHWQADRPSGFFTFLATYRIMGHPKTNLGENYTTAACGKCHPENAGHPEKPLQTTCNRCHDKALENPLLLGSLHLQMTFADNPLAYLLRIFYGLGFFAAVIGGAGFFGYRTYRKRKAQKPDASGEGARPPESAA